MNEKKKKNTYKETTNHLRTKNIPDSFVFHFKKFIFVPGEKVSMPRPVLPICKPPPFVYSLASTGSKQNYFYPITIVYAT